MVSLGSRVHIFARPRVKHALVECFSRVLGCGDPGALDVPGLEQPILAWNFPGGGSLSVEFSDNAPEERDPRRGAWIELRAEDPIGLSSRLGSAGLAQINYLGNDNYFVLPGGQVLRVEAAESLGLTNRPCELGAQPHPPTG